jgi:hypothetical protein
MAPSGPPSSSPSSVIGARQLGAIVGPALILLIACLSIRWLGARSRGALVAVGFSWLALLLTFELPAGHFVAGFPWSRIASDYDPRHGGLLSLGMLVQRMDQSEAQASNRFRLARPPGVG